MKTPELKPCPFCGGEAYICETLGVWHIDCHHTKKCKIRPSTFLLGDSTMFKQIKAWNRRVTDETA